MSEQNPSEGLPPQPPQQSFGAAQPPPGQGFGAAPPPPGQSFGAAPPPPPMPAQPAEPAPKKKKGGVLRVIVPLVVVAVIAAGGWWFTRKEAQNAKVGDCLAGTSPEELNAEKLTIVPCTQSDAGFKVVERVENKTRAQSDSSCTESTEDRWVYWYGPESGGSGTVLCLGRNTPS